MEDLANRVESLNTPDELKGAQGELELAFQLRSDALTGISDQISTALGTEGSRGAVNCDRRLHGLLPGERRAL